jgi:hypothetical protein
MGDVERSLNRARSKAMRRSLPWFCRLRALVFALVLLSVILGDTGTAQAAGSAEFPLLQPASVCEPDATPFDTLRGTAARAGDGAFHRAESVPWASPGTTAGVPPWTTFPASPLPRVGGLLARSPLLRVRPLDIIATRAAWTAEAGPGLNPSLSLGAPGWSEPCQPLERIAGPHQRFPRPPPRAAA